MRASGTFKVECTQKDLVPPKACSELVSVNTEHAPILGEALCTDAEFQARGADDGAKNTTIKVLPLCRDPVYQIHKFFQRNVLVAEQCLGVGTRGLRVCNNVGVAALLPLHRILDARFQSFDRERRRCDHESDVFREVGTGLFTEQDNVLRGHTLVVRVVDAAFARFEEDVVTGEAQESVALTALGEVEAHGALDVGTSRSRDVEAKGRSERTDGVDESVKKAGRSEKLRASLAHVEGFAEVDIHVGDLRVGQKG